MRKAEFVQHALDRSFRFQVTGQAYSEARARTITTYEIYAPTMCLN